MEIDHLDHIDFCRQIDSCSLRRDEYDDAVLLVGRGDDLVFDINGNSYGGRRGSQIRRRGGRRQLRHYSGVDFVHADRPRRPPQTRLLGRRHLQRHRYETHQEKNLIYFHVMTSSIPTGWLMMKNWRPLSLTQIASSERETVGGVLGELTTVATLRIYIRK